MDCADGPYGKTPDFIYRNVECPYIRCIEICNLSPSQTGLDILGVIMFVFIKGNFLYTAFYLNLSGVDIIKS